MPGNPQIQQVPSLHLEPLFVQQENPLEHPPFITLTRIVRTTRSKAITRKGNRITMID